MHFDRFCVRRSAFRGWRRQGTGERGERETVVSVWRRHHSHQAWQESTGAFTHVKVAGMVEMVGGRMGIGTHFAKVGVLFFVTGVARCLCRSLCHLFSLLLFFYLTFFVTWRAPDSTSARSTPRQALRGSVHAYINACMRPVLRRERPTRPRSRASSGDACERWTTLKRLCFVRR